MADWRTWAYGDGHTQVNPTLKNSPSPRKKNFSPKRQNDRAPDLKLNLTINPNVNLDINLDINLNINVNLES